MDTKLKKLLMQRSTAYKDVPADVIQELAKLSENLGMETKKIAGVFDKFMTISRQQSSSVTMDDVEAFAKEQTVLSTKTKTSSVFAKTEWDEYVLYRIVLRCYYSNFHTVYNTYESLQNGCLRQCLSGLERTCAENITICGTNLSCTR